MIHHGDCLDVMAAMEPESVDAIVTDPPYGLGFMGKAWDTLAETPTEVRWNKRERNLDVTTASLEGKAGIENFRHSASGTTFADPNPRCAKCGKVRQGSPKYVCQCGDDWSPAPRENRQAQRSQAWHQQWAEAAYRVAKPSAYLLAFGGTRTVHRMTVALEDAGWIIRDMLVWGYASGFPKSKASLKPAWEPIVMARKPGPLRMLAIDECRIAAPENVGVTWTRGGKQEGASLRTNTSGENEYVEANPAGRWPANIVLTDPIFDGGIEGVVGGGEQSGGGNPRRRIAEPGNGVTMGGGWTQHEECPDFPEGMQLRHHVDGSHSLVGYETGLEPVDTSGTYSRFFLVPKAARTDREPVLGGLPLRQGQTSVQHGGKLERWPDGHLEPRKTPLPQRANVHPTVKPTDLMRHLVRLVTPTGGVVLDPFLGSGTTALAAEMEGFDWIGIEREAEYVAIAEARLNGTQRGLGLEAS